MRMRRTRSADFDRPLGLSRALVSILSKKARFQQRFVYELDMKNRLQGKCKRENQLIAEKWATLSPEGPNWSLDETARLRVT